MKNVALILMFTVFATIGVAQTTLLSENFDGSAISFSASSSGTSASWSINNTLSVSGAKSDSAIVQTGDSLFLESNTFSTMGYTFIAFKFNQIAKISFFDKGIIEYSIDNGAHWTQLTSSDYNGSGYFYQNSFSAVSYSKWDIANASAVPDSSWWTSESFSLSSAAGQSQVKVRFVLIDADNNGAVNNYGWLLDDVRVIGSPCEIIPPAIQLTGNIVRDSVFNTGPYLIEADIQDASGINSAFLLYSLNGGTVDTITMSNSSGNTYQATIPTTVIGDSICYSILAYDGTTCKNKAFFPQSCIPFIVTTSPPPTCVGTPISNFNYEESFATFTAGNGLSNGGSLAKNWVNDAANSYDWWVFNRSTSSTSTGPSADHSANDDNYLYVEASPSYTNNVAIIKTPCYDLTNVAAPNFSFWYHMYGGNMGDLHVDIFFGGKWVLDIMPAVSGNQGNQWSQKSIDLSPYQGNVVKLRFRAVMGSGYQSDIAIDDIEITGSALNDLALSSIISPSSTSCNGSANEYLTVELTNLGLFTYDTIPLVYQINNGTIILDTAFLTLTPNASVNHTFQQTFNMSSPGAYLINSWIDLAVDGNHSNDSILNFTANTSPITTNFPDTTSFDNFTVGVPGTFKDDWNNSSNDQHDWYVYNGSTPSSQTGPSADHTSGSGNYVYMEATGVNQSAEAILISKCFDISNLNSPELTFYYSMYGNTMGDLHLDISINGVLIQDIIQPISGDQGNAWIKQVVNLSAYSGVIKLIFRAVRGSGIRSDIALDDLSIRDAQTVGLSTIKSLNKRVLIFPNPVNDKLIVHIEDNTVSAVAVYNALGELVLQDQLINRSNQLNFSALSPGIYFVRIYTNGEVVSKKVLKQ